LYHVQKYVTQKRNVVYNVVYVTMSIWFMMQHVVSTEILMRYSTCSLLHYNMRSTKIKAKLIFPSTLQLSSGNFCHAQKILMYRRKRGYVVSHCAFTLYRNIQYYNSAKKYCPHMQRIDLLVRVSACICGSGFKPIIPYQISSL